ncbi:MAG TPA: NUDIX hydrolase [Hyphomicrobiaceae bacterium]|nr:NUDIX hydrolase [Hyphomicrobiaceae bacterium]
MAELAQYAALPYVMLGSDLSVCLITSRGTRRWIIPKGWPKPALQPYELAAREAVEEAGLFGEIAPDPIGSYTYRKRLHFFASADCRVVVYPLLVTAQYGHWPEQGQRELIWVPAPKAAGMVREPELGRLLASLPRWIAAQPTP